MKFNFGQMMAETLLGTTEFIDNLEDIPQEYLEELDSLAFQCDYCDWWCPIEEMSKDRICLDCNL